MQKLIVSALAAVMALSASAAKKSAAKLQFDASKGVAGSVEMPSGRVNYTAYTKLYFVTNVEDTTYQYVNVFVPEGATPALSRMAAFTDGDQVNRWDTNLQADDRPFPPPSSSSQQWKRSTEK